MTSNSLLHAEILLQKFWRDHHACRAGHANFNSSSSDASVWRCADINAVACLTVFLSSLLVDLGSLAGVFALSNTALPLSSPFASAIPTADTSTSSESLSFMECLAFGALISATDPVSTLAVFADMHVEPNLFAIVFGEAVLNDAVVRDKETNTKQNKLQ